MTKLVVSFNRHFFVMAIVACVTGAILMAMMEHPWIRWSIGFGVLTAIYFIICSIIASYFIYDHSDLYKLREWPAKSLPTQLKSVVLIHAGFDPVSGAFRARFPATNLRVLDFFTPEETTEASIQLAHRLNPPTGPQEHTSSDAWPVETDSQDAVLALSAAHEIRVEDKRVRFFQEAGRVIGNNGRIVVIEQMRDLPNFLCFGVAAFHFLSRRTWLRSFKSANLTVTSEFKITPFMRVFVLRRDMSS